MSRAFGISCRTVPLGRVSSSSGLVLSSVLRATNGRISTKLTTRWYPTRTISSSTPSSKRLERTAAPKKPKGIKKSDSAIPTKEGSAEGAGSTGERPAFVKTPAVSAREMVAAIVSRRKDTDPFTPNADPFANRLDSAIQAGLKGTGSASSGRRDSRHNRANVEPASGVQLPDVQAHYLVGPARWESVQASDVKIKNITPSNRPKVAALEHGLDRVLFNPGVHWLQDPRSSVFNFDPYLRSICQPEDFDYNALPAYKTSSMDPSLLNVTKKHKAKYMGSTSSMTSILSQFYYLISAWKPLKTSHLSGAFASQPKGFTRLSRAPTTIQLVYKGSGVYAVDADKTFDSNTVLMQLGKSMEKMLTSTPEEFSRFTKENSWQVSKTERNEPEAFNYITAENFVLRSQLDCEDPRLPGKTFDLKTRAAVAIRLDVHNYEQNQGYQLSKAHGYLESFEREYYDMMRSAFLKYSLQVRIGQMDGIFVAFHNTAKIFGFQYISLDEMDSRLFGTSVMGDECFRNQLRVLNRTLDEITKKYPEQDLKITVDTDETVQSMNVWVETMPLGAASSPQGKNVEIRFDENGAPEMQPGGELSLWQIVCYSNINSTPTVGPFELNDRATDLWELRFKIAELNKPHMMNEYRRVKALQAEILSDDKEREAAAAAAAAAESKNSSEAVEKTATRFDAMRDKLRRISERGRVKAEHEEKRQASQGLLVWEPKGYVKISEITSDSVVSAATAPVVSAATAPIVSAATAPIVSAATAPIVSAATAPVVDITPQSITSRMVEKLNKLKESKSESKSEPNSESKSEPNSESKSESTNESKSKSSASTKNIDSNPAMPSIQYKVYSNPVDSIRLAIKDLDLIRKAVTSDRPLVGKELSRFEELSKSKHAPLIKSSHAFDEIRFRLLSIPTKRAAYNPFDRVALERMADTMELPKSEITPELSDSDLRKKLFRSFPKYKSRQHLEYFHKHLHKVLTLRSDTKPFKSVEEFIASPGNLLGLERAIQGLNLNSSHVTRYHFFQKMSKLDAAKKGLLSQIWYSEQKFSDDELKAWGLFPRIFNPEKYKSTRDIFRAGQTNYAEMKAYKKLAAQRTRESAPEAVKAKKKAAAEAMKLKWTAHAKKKSAELPSADSVMDALIADTNRFEKSSDIFVSDVKETEKSEDAPAVEGKDAKPYRGYDVIFY
ncbi:hypothetical protein BGZ83_008780 [Gryganskiella cystojenkinii]|nr:hypothetical protein BGZ83_008780 [Gryganskiella cystojenkinii]